VHYQPIRDLDTGAVVAAPLEPVGDAAPRRRIIALAERSGEMGQGYYLGDLALGASPASSRRPSR
jgi:hypothetical protein